MIKGKWRLLVEGLGIIAVVGSLILVAIEIRQNTNMMQAQTRDAITDKILFLYDMVAGDTETNEIWVKGLNAELDTAADSNRFRVLTASMIRIWENEWYQYQQGLFSNEDFEPRMEVWKVFIQNPNTLSIWESTRSQYSASFGSQLDKLVDNQ